METAALPGAAPTAQPGVWQRFGAGMGYPLRGASLVAKHPRLVPLCLAPIATVTLGLGLLFYGVSAWASSLATRMPGGHSWFGRLLGGVFVTLVTLVFVTLVYYLYAALISVAASPFCGALSEKTEEIATGVKPPGKTLGKWLVEAGRGLWHALLRAFVYLCIAGPIWFFGALIPPLSPLLTVLSFYVTSLFLAYDFLDYPLSTRCAGFGEKWTFVDKHRAESLGFGFVVGLLLLVPLVNLLVAPFAAVGGTLLYVDLAKRA